MDVIDNKKSNNKHEQKFIAELKSYFKNLIKLLQYLTDLLVITQIINGEKEENKIFALRSRKDYSYIYSLWEFLPVAGKRLKLIELESELFNLLKLKIKEGVAIPERNKLVDDFLTSNIYPKTFCN